MADNSVLDRQVPLETLKARRCPHCGIANPFFKNTGHEPITRASDGSCSRKWAFFVCSSCGGVVTASYAGRREFLRQFPEESLVDTALPEPAREYLQQAIDSRQQPAASVVVCASSIDSMLKVKGYTKKEEGLYARINHAVADHVITPEMGEWAHEVRLEANEQRHADENCDLPTVEDAERCIEFAQALGMFLFVLPKKIADGRKKKGPKQKETMTVKIQPGQSKCEVTRQQLPQKAFITPQPSPKVGKM